MAKQFTPIQLDKQRNLRYGHKALILVEDSMGRSLSKLNFEDLKLRELTKLLWAGLVHEDPMLTLDQLIDIIDDCDSMNIIEEIAEKIGLAISEAFGKNQPAPAQKARKK